MNLGPSPLPKKTLEEQLNEAVTKVHSVFGELVVRVRIVADGIEIRLFNESQKEQLLIKYNKQEIEVEVDLACKEIISVKALGLEIQTREPLQALQMAAQKIVDNMTRIQDFAKTDIDKIQAQANGSIQRQL